MKSAFVSLGAIGLIASPAFAQKSTVEFTSSEGQVTVAVFDAETMTVSVEGADPTPYTFDEDTHTLCGLAPSGEEVCFTFENASSEVGTVMPFKASNGETGTALMKSVE